jgi:hypothetical protein
MIIGVRYTYMYTNRYLKRLIQESIKPNKNTQIKVENGKGN